MGYYQTPRTKPLDLKDHIWLKRRRDYKCCTCGAVTGEIPPFYPTPHEWMPVKYEVLTKQEREML